MSLPPDPLAALPPLVLPDAPGIWPLAPGWWLLMVFAAGLLLLALSLWRRYRLQSRWKYIALRELDALYQQFNDSAIDTFEFTSGCAALLRRFCRQQYPRATLHTLSGEQWRLALNSCATPATLGPKLLLTLEAHYLPDPGSAATDKAVVEDCYQQLQAWFSKAGVAS